MSEGEKDPPPTPRPRRKRPRDPFPAVRVTWLDALQLREETELSADEAITRAHSPLITTTIGYLIRRDPVGITLAAERQVQPDGPTFRGITFIPAAMISRVRGGGQS